MISGFSRTTKVHPIFGTGDVRSGAFADRLTFVGSKARAVKAGERVEINFKDET